MPTVEKLVEGAVECRRVVEVHEVSQFVAYHTSHHFLIQQHQKVGDFHIALGGAVAQPAFAMAYIKTLWNMTHALRLLPSEGEEKFRGITFAHVGNHLRDGFLHHNVIEIDSRGHGHNEMIRHGFIASPH